MRNVLVFFTLMLAATAGHAAQHCVIIQYHHFSTSTPAATSVTPQQFDHHLRYLKENNFHVMSLRDVVLSLHHRIELPDKCVSLTVDDAYLSVYNEAYPRLKELGWPMTVFVNSESIDQANRSFMSWQQMREMSQYNFDFENHGHAHIHMIRKQEQESEDAWLNRVRLNIETAQNRISKELSQAPVLFAWPYGEYDLKLVGIIKKLGLTGFGQQSGPVWPDANPGYLPRFPMASRYANLEGFKTKVNTLPLPVVESTPKNSITPVGDWRPTLTLRLAPGLYTKESLQCFISGSDKVKMVWSSTDADTVHVVPDFDLSPGRHRTNCTMPSSQKGHFHWYSHNWFIRHEDGSWYAEY